MKLLLTGGTGFFGKALLRHWCGEDDLGLAMPTVNVLSRSPELFKKSYPEFNYRKWLIFHQGDILLPSTLPKGDYTHILHAATDSTFGPKLSALERYTQIVDGTQNMLAFAAANKVPRFLLTSSGGVYGAQQQNIEHMPETYFGMADPLNPQNTYSVAKRVAEHLCALYQERHGIETVIARCFAFVGRDLPLDAHFAIGNFIRDALSNQEIVVSSNGSPVRSYMDQRDLADWLIKLLSHGMAGQAYNVGSDEAITIRDLAYLVRDTLAPKMPVKIQVDSNLYNFRNRYVPLIDKAKKELGLALNFSLTQSLEDVAKFTIV